MRISKKGFTLIELLIVIVIIGILAAALVPRLLSVQERARDTKRKVDLQQIASALEIYKADNNYYPEPTYNNTPSLLCISGMPAYPACNNHSMHALYWLHGLTTWYITSQPADPISANKGPYGLGSVRDGPWYVQVYSYAYVGDKKHYSLVTRLENTKDPDRCSIKNVQVWWTDSVSTYFCATMSRAAFTNDVAFKLDTSPLYVVTAQ